MRIFVVLPVLIASLSFVPKAAAAFKIQGYVRDAASDRKQIIMTIGDPERPMRYQVFKGDKIGAVMRPLIEMKLISAAVDSKADRLDLEFMDERTPSIGNMSLSVSVSGRGALTGQGFYRHVPVLGGLTFRQFPILRSFVDRLDVEDWRQRQQTKFSAFITRWRQRNPESLDAADVDPIVALFEPPLTGGKISRLKSAIRGARRDDLQFIATQIANFDDPFRFKSILLELTRKGDEALLRYLVNDLLTKPIATTLDAVAARLVARKFTELNEHFGLSLLHQSHLHEMRLTLDAMASYGGGVEMLILTAALERSPFPDFSLLQTMIQNPNWPLTTNIPSLLSRWGAWRGPEAQAVAESARISNADERKRAIKVAINKLKIRLASRACTAFETENR